ncbi:MAG: 16S rRNA (cytidine(1402)-2'-O)-methyltransferase, partial [Alphaproteobacteria bacterium]|nr:16S rRNA (cytidine(1402)-2'-O)-methyltransferase [Alphaproteobacteria bacterium]
MRRKSPHKRPGQRGDDTPSATTLPPRAGEPRDSNAKDEARQMTPALTPGLYLVATPIGNAADISLRALAVLRAVDLIAAEDTRVTAKLLAIHGLARPVVSYREANAATAGEDLVRRLAAGQSIALVSDAGTPLIADPGERLVTAALAAGVAVTAVPGPSAPLAALLLSGLPTAPHFFLGFLPARATERRRVIAGLRALEATLLVLEAPHRLAEG